MHNQEDLFNTLNLPNREEAERLKSNFGNNPLVDKFIESYTDKIRIDGKTYDRTPDPDRSRKLKPPTDKPIVSYCNSDYYLLNTAKLQSVRDLTLIVGILPSTGKHLLDGEYLIELQDYYKSQQPKTKTENDRNNYKWS